VEDVTCLSPSHSSNTSDADAGLSADGVTDFAVGESVLSAAEAWLFGVYTLHNNLPNMK